MRRIRLLGMLLSSLAFAACGILPAPSESSPPNRVVTAAEDLRLAIANDTTLTVSLVVDGVVVGVYPGGTGRPEGIPASELPAVPWSVEARAPSGRLLTSMTVRAGDVWSADTANGGTQIKGDAVRVDLSCGRLDIWSGPPLAGPMPSPGSPGDCAP